MMVINMKSAVKTSRGGARAGAGSGPHSSPREREVIFVRQRHPQPQPQPRCCVAADRASREAAIEEEADDVIDLGAPRVPRRRTPAPPATRRHLPPNPRLYPGPKPAPAPSPRVRRRGGRRRPRPLRRPVPNSRLYRPAPPRPPAPAPPPARPRAAWPPPAPPRALDTASRAALRLLPAPSAPPPARAPSPRCGPARRLVVTLPDAAQAVRYRPASEHFRARTEPGAGAGSGESTPPAARLSPAPVMERPSASASPEDHSDGNDPSSAPSEFLAEFLSAIMRRQYAEALKYCRLILQYEPHNATARGFYPLLRHKLARHQRTEEAAEAAAAAAAGDGADSSGDESPARRSTGESLSLREKLTEPSTESGDGDGDCGESEESAAGEHSDLELDSSSPSLSLSRRSERTERSERSERTDDSASGSASAGAGWESTGSASRSDAGAGAGAEADDNGNVSTARVPLLPDDLENENSAACGEPHRTATVKSESVSSLRRLRAQFACSIK